MSKQVTLLPFVLSSTAKKDKQKETECKGLQTFVFVGLHESTAIPFDFN